MSAGPWKNHVYKNKKKKNRSTKAAALKAVKSLDMKFKVATDLSLDTAGHGSKQAIVQALYNQAKSLPIDRKTSVIVPADAGKPNQVGYYCSCMNKLGKEVFCYRTVLSSDGKKTYLGARIWRIE